MIGGIHRNCGTHAPYDPMREDVNREFEGPNPHLPPAKMSRRTRVATTLVPLLSAVWAIGCEMRSPGNEGSPADADSPETLSGLAGFNDAVPIQGGYVLNLWVPTAEGIGHPLHFVKGGTLIRSFGAEPESSGVLDPLGAMRVLGRDQGNRVLASRRFDYVIEAWDTAGHRLGHWRGPKLNDSVVKPTFFGPDNPLPSEIVGIRGDGRHVWVLMRVPRPGWLNQVVEQVYPTGEVGYRIRDDATPASLFAGRIDVIDLSRGSIVASKEVDGFLAAIDDQGLIIQNDWSPNGSPVMRVWRATLEPHGGRYP